VRFFAVASGFAAALGGAPAHAGPRWIQANFHAHAASTVLQDDGSEPPEALHRALRARGFDFSVHSAHSTVNTDPDAAAHFVEQRAHEDGLAIPGLTVVLGEELTVANGPNFQHRTHVLGHDAPGNLNHVTIFGMRSFVPSGTPLAQACAQVHAEGGLCLVNHPGPGPMMWEEGLWEAAGNRGSIDGLEVYNGQALSTVGIDFEARYREATAYSGLGLHIAATTGADTHGPKSVERARARLAGLGAAGKFIKLVLPGSSEARPELDAATLVRADSASVSDVIAALKARRTVARYRMRGVEVELPGLGEIRHTDEVALHLHLSRKVAEVTLYREGTPVKSWTHVDDVTFEEKIDRPSAYVFSARDGRDGGGRLTTSAIWYEPR
jgi:hypothetical protein